MSRQEKRRRNRAKANNFNLRRTLKARLLRAPAYNHQLLDDWWSVMLRRGLV